MSVTSCHGVVRGNYKGVGRRDICCGEIFREYNLCWLLVNGASTCVLRKFLRKYINVSVGTYCRGTGTAVTRTHEHLGCAHSGDIPLTSYTYCPYVEWCYSDVPVTYFNGRVPTYM